MITLTAMQLRRAADIKEQIDSLKTEFDSIFNPLPLVPESVTAETLLKPLPKRRRMSAEARAKISLAAKRRWKNAKIEGKKHL